MKRRISRRWLTIGTGGVLAGFLSGCSQTPEEALVATAGMAVTLLRAEGMT